MSTDTVAVNDADDSVVDQILEQAEPQEQNQEAETKEERVPLSALQKERRKRQEAEQELKVYRDHQLNSVKAKPVEEDESRFESATKGDLGKTKEEIIRAVEERNWIKQNPERYEEVNEKLAAFLKQRPNLASAIDGASNRFEEAWELMDKLSPKQKASLTVKSPLKKDAPGSPSGMPKAAALNQAVDVMSMSESEFAAYREAKRKRR